MSLEDLLHMPSDDSSQPRMLNSLDEMVSVLSLNTCLRLDEFSLFMPLEDTRRSVVRWLREKYAGDNAEAFARLIPVSVDVVDALAEELAMSIISEMAEERPGTSPWEHDGNIPVPLMMVNVVGHTVGTCANTARVNNHLVWARQGYDIMTSLFAWLAHEIGTSAEVEEPTEMPAGPHGRRFFNGVSYKLPQPAVAQMARYMEGTATRIDDKEWLIGDENPSEEELAEQKTFTDNLRDLADMLRFLNKRYGQSPNPTAAS
jgi:hypothetical protein